MIMNKKDDKPGLFSAEFWIDTMGWRRDERIDQASQQNMKVLTWVYTIEFFLMGIYQLFIASYNVAIPLLAVATVVTLWFAWQHRRFGDDEYGLAQLGKHYQWSGGIFAVAAVFIFIGALIVFGEMNLIWNAMILIPSFVVIALTQKRQMFGRRTWITIAIVSVGGGLFGFFLGMDLLSSTAAWLILALIGIFFAAIFWLYYKQ